MHAKTLIVVAGPTAVGKTNVAISLAAHFSTEIMSADSRQIFRELTIGTAKPSPEELSMVKHHFINSNTIHEAYDAAQFGRDALALIHHLFKIHDRLILCGGSGLYVKAVCEGFDDIPEVSPDIRAALMEEYKNNGVGALQDKLKKLDPGHFESIDINNPHRLIRALEVVIGTGVSIASFQKKAKLAHNFSILKVGLELPRQELYERIEVRMDKMIRDGLFEEAAQLYEFRSHNALQTVGYQEIFDFMAGKYDRNEAIRLLKQNSRRYAKRQLTWFKRDPEMVWMNPANIDGIIEMILKQGSSVQKKE
ncbi:MAG: tRNA (adenosine(37)-N6)-dimethylallyltransferase MiaA [Marivirga sp.]|nr:tRNA (adenosine(37)-N6)-dimethylallyltransferase MiaA [Marivirga sp.]